MGSPADLLIAGKILGTDAAAKCMRMKWSDDRITVLEFYGGSGKSTFFSCQQIDSPKNQWDCKHLKGQNDPIDLSHTAYITYTDNKSVTLTYRCFPALGQQGWVVWTTTPTVSAQAKKKVFASLKGLGIPVGLTEVLDRQYSLCDQVCLT